jgi:Ca2+/Na+ antiporter
MTSFCYSERKCIANIKQGFRHLFTIKKQLIILCIYLAFVTISFGNNTNHNIADSAKHEFSHDDIKVGERLFYGLIKTGDNTVSCASCHYYFQGDTVNWNPSAYEIAASVAESDISLLKNALLNPTGKKISEVHKNIKLSEEQIGLIRGYLLELHKKGATPSKPKVTNLFIFIALLVLNLSAIILLILRKAPKLKFVYFIVVLVTGIFLTKYIVDSAINLGRSQNYEPDQPIKFSHLVHVKQNKIDCKYCHSTVEYSKTAGIPSANVCMNCHVIVREGTRSGKFEINKIIKAVEKNQPVEWIKVHNLQDHVFFSHAQHVAVGKIDCITCHGDVGSMNRVKQVSDLSMGWCINCHRDTKVQSFNEAFYTKYEELHRKLKTGEIDSITVENIGGTECMKCHY